MTKLPEEWGVAFGKTVVAEVKAYFAREIKSRDEEIKALKGRIVALEAKVKRK